jgi:hypothetical protein
MPYGNQFQSSQFGQGLPKTAFSCSVVVQHAKEIDRVTWQSAGVPVTEDPGAGTGR